MRLSDVPRETADKLLAIKAMVLEEQRSQNLISANTIETFDERHIDDSLQLLDHVVADGPLIDIGAGAGFPGLVLAACRSGPTHLVEPRAKRAAFLGRVVETLGLGSRAFVHACKVERLELSPAAIITARAVATLDKLFTWAEPVADRNTRWVLPKGRSAASELDQARQSWQGDFRLVPSLTDPEAAIVIAEHVRRRKSR